MSVEVLYTAILSVPGLEFLVLGVLVLLSWLFARTMTARPRNLAAAPVILGGAVAVLVLWGLGAGGIL